MIPEVREQLETVMEIGQSRKRMDLDVHLSTMDPELRKAKDVLSQYSTWFTDPAAIALRTKINNIQ